MIERVGYPSLGMTYRGNQKENVKGYSTEKKLSENNINTSKTTVSFGRALTSEEKTEYKGLVKEAFDSLGIKNFAAIAFDVSFPSASNKDTGMGSSFSKGAEKFLGFLNDTLGVNAVQLGPQGDLSSDIISPYSGSVFPIGSHIIDLGKLTQNSYGSILDKHIYDGIVENNPNNNGAWKVPYDYTLTKQSEALKSAFDNFKQLGNYHDLKLEFKRFKLENKEWLKSDALYEALSKKHNDEFWPNWKDELDQNLFGKDKGTEKAEQRIDELEDSYKDVIEYHDFVQFIADKQQKEAKKSAKAHNVNIIGDCLIGFSPREQWANLTAFKPGQFIGCPGQYWGLPAIDTDKIVNKDGSMGEAGKLLKQKFDLFFKRNDGTRIDAAWQLITPWVYEASPKSPGKPTKDGNFEYGVGNKIINVLVKSAEENNIRPNKIIFELLGDIKDPVWNVLNNQVQMNDKKVVLPKMHISQYGGWDYARAKIIPEQDYFTIGTHDNDSIISIANNSGIRNKQVDYLSQDLRLNANELKDSPEKFREAKFAELFTTKNPMLMVFDLLGMDIRFNNFNCDASESAKKDNWSYRVPNDYEKFYHSQLTKGYGLNLPQALKTAINAKSSGQFGSLTARLDRAAKVLKEDGPMSTEDADKVLGKTFSAFEYAGVIR